MLGSILEASREGIQSQESAMVFALKCNRNSSFVQLFQPSSLLCSKSMHAKARLCLDFHIPSRLKFSPELKFLPKPFRDLPTNSLYPKMMFSLPKKHNFMTTLPISITIQYNLCKILISDFFLLCPASYLSFPHYSHHLIWNKTPMYVPTCLNLDKKDSLWDTALFLFWSSSNSNKDSSENFEF